MFRRSIVTVKVAINGFGRIGRLVFRAMVEQGLVGKDVDVVAVGDIVPADNLAYLLKYDTTQGRFAGEVSSRKSSPDKAEDDILIVNGRDIHVVSAKSPAELPWKAAQPTMHDKDESPREGQAHSISALVRCRPHAVRSCPCSMWPISTTRDEFAHDEQCGQRAAFRTILAQHQLVERREFPWHHLEFLGFVARQSLRVEISRQHQVRLMTHVSGRQADRAQDFKRACAMAGFLLQFAIRGL